MEAINHADIRESDPAGYKYKKFVLVLA